MPTPALFPVQLQTRDLYILRLLYDHGFLLTEHVFPLFSNCRDARRRLGKLERAGLIYKTHAVSIKGAKVIRATRIGRAAAESCIAYRIGRSSPLQQTKLVHDSLVIKTRQRLETLWNGHWIPEPLLPRNQDIPDGVFVFPSGRKVFVEVENSHKAKDRFLSRLVNFSGQTLVLYVATMPAVERSIKKTLAQGPKDLASTALVSLDALLGSPSPTVWSPRHELSLFHAREF